MRVLFVGESAAGHLSPIIAVYEEIKKIVFGQEAEHLKFMLITTESHFLKEIFEETGIPYKIIKAPKGIMSGLYGLASFLQTIYYVFDFMPDVIFSKGGRVSLPVLISGWIFRIPIIIHESDAVVRPMDEFMFRFARKVAISFESTKEVYGSPKAFFTGNPVRDFISRGSKEKAIADFILKNDKPVILIMGGSEGAEEINNLVLEIIPDLLKKYQIIHQCGIGNYDKIKSAMESMNISNLNDYHLFPFFKKRIADAYAACDLIISRAGANTVSEIMAVAKPSILIPLASAVSDKQTKNAHYYSQAGAAILVSEKNLKPHLFLAIIEDLLKSDLKIMEMKKAARTLARPEAARKIAEETIKLGK